MKSAPALLLLLLTFAASAASPKPPAAAPSSVPAKALAEIPALPKAAKKDLDCSAAEVFGARIQRQSEQDSAAMQAAMAKPATAQTLTEEQTAAIQALDDSEFHSCVTDLQQRPSELWVLPLREGLDARLAGIDAARIKADEAWCTKHAAETCTGDPAGAKRSNAQAVTAGTQFLKDAQPAYAGYLKEIADCVGKRDKVEVRARAAGLTGRSAATAIGATQDDWTLVGIAAGAQSAVCMAAREAANRFLEQP